MILTDSRTTHLYLSPIRAPFFNWQFPLEVSTQKSCCYDWVKHFITKTDHTRDNLLLLSLPFNVNQQCIAILFDQVIYSDIQKYISGAWGFQANLFFVLFYLNLDFPPAGIEFKSNLHVHRSNKISKDWKNFPQIS